MASEDPFSASATFEMSNGDVGRFSNLHALENAGLCELAKLPCTIRVLLEASLRKCDGFLVTEDDVKRIAAWSPTQSPAEIPFMPSRVILQDFTGVPAVVDIAALRELSDKAALVQIQAVPGLGRWSAEIYLMFSLGRPDLWPSGDVGAMRGLQKILELEVRPTPMEADALALRYSPHRTAMALLAWKCANATAL